MRFFESQREARARSRRLVLAFGLTVLLLVLAVNLALALGWWLSGGFFFSGALRFPRHFWAVNTGMTLFFVLGGWWLETSQLQHQGAVRLAERMGARALRPSGEPAEQRFANIVDELAIASGLPRPVAMVVARDAAINAFATGWDADGAVVAVTQGALDQLTREELQGLVAHELGHIGEGDTRLNLRLAGMVFGLEMVYRLGQRLLEPDERGGRFLWAVMGFFLMAAGWLGWVAGHALQAAVSRQREFLADARAVQWTRSRDGLGGVLRKVMTQQREGVEARAIGAPLQHLLLVGNAPGRLDRWLDSHPPLAERVRRIYGRPMGPLPLARPEPVGDPTVHPA
ncbi:M48 family metalloprotease [Hydrogenophaga sp. T2]|uniref:M48 family metalloprotease n=1 Tax=Hydrogenophaga sp. T2 TaxID=3132823 RepID=UPI003CECECDD